VNELTLRHELACTPERHWELFFDPKWQQTLIVGGLGFFSCEVGELERRGDDTKRSMRVTPKIDVPAPVAKLLGPKLAYTELGSFHEPTKTWTYELKLSVLAEKIRLGGRVNLEPVGADRCRRISYLYMDVRIPLIGGLVEKAAEKNMRDGWDRSATWVNGWLAEHPPA
jgi:hypothetical protein